jgi:hypothetical protein
MNRAQFILTWKQLKEKIAFRRVRITDDRKIAETLKSAQRSDHQTALFRPDNREKRHELSLNCEAPAVPASIRSARYTTRRPSEPSWPHRSTAWVGRFKASWTLAEAHALPAAAGYRHDNALDEGDVFSSMLSNGEYSTAM